MTNHRYGRSLSDTGQPSRFRQERASRPAPARFAGSNRSAPGDAAVGGQALIEGVMMRGVSNWAVAIRRPLPEQLVDGFLPSGEAAEGEVEVQLFPFRSVLSRRPLLRLPIVRGVVALVESLKIGMKALRISTLAQTDEEIPPPSRLQWALAMTVAALIAVGLFFVTPVGLTSLLQGPLGTGWLFWLVEGIVRTAIFIGYITLLTRFGDLGRVFEYHGAEHKVIACYEAGKPLTPANADRFSRLHPRCGTSFLLFVMVVAIFVFAPIGVPEWYWLIASRIVGIPLIVGISFELIKFAGKHRTNPLAKALSWPGMQLQRLTTRPPDYDQLEVAIAALQAILSVEDPKRARPRDLVGIEVAA